MKVEEKILRNLHQELQKAKTQAKSKYQKEMIKIDQAELKKRHDKLDYLLDFQNIPIDKNWLERIFKDYLSIMKGVKKDNGKVLEKLKQGFEQKEIDLEVLIKKVFSFNAEHLENLAKKLKLEPEDLNFLGLHLGNPVFELYAQRIKETIDINNWSKGFCPICGSSPTMAYFRKGDGKRILWCQFCSTQWSFLRLKCPFCSNEDQETLRYFFTEEYDHHKVYVCDKCKKYLKTIEQRKMENPDDLDLAWENLSTLALDLVAEKEGFLNPSSYPPEPKRRVVT